jgi:hypothetical protein
MLSEPQVVGLTLFGEARGEPVEGRIAVANVIRNRVVAQRRTFGLTPRDVCLKPWQFSCWRQEGGAANYGDLLSAARLLSRGVLAGPMLRECLWIAHGLLDRQFGDSVHGATHYLTAELFARNRPVWSVGHDPVCHVNSHLFFAGIA